MSARKIVSQLYGYAQREPIAPQFSGTMDWFPRRGVDLDAGIRLRRDAKPRENMPWPHLIGGIFGMLPQFDVWKFWNRSPVDPGPIVNGRMTAPATNFRQQDYTSLKKGY